MALSRIPVQVEIALPAGNNNIGDVDLASAIPAGANIIGKVGLDTAANTAKIDQTGSNNGVQVVAALPAGTNNIGDVDLASSLPTGANTIGKVGIDAASGNTIQISQSGSENGVQVVAALPAGANIIGKVEIVSSTGAEKETYAKTGAVVPMNQASTQTVGSAGITNGTTGTLTEVTVSARVGMTALIQKTDGTTPTDLFEAEIPSGGGAVTIKFENVAKNQQAGNAGGTAKFQVVFTNDDVNQDAYAKALFKWSEA